MKYDYPINQELIKRLKQEYRDEAIDKGNSWRDKLLCSLPYLVDKVNEEYTEVDMSIARQLPNSVIQSEIIDLIEILGMLYWRLEK